MSLSFSGRIFFNFLFHFSASRILAAAADTPSPTPTRVSYTTPGRRSGTHPTPSSTGLARPAFPHADPPPRWSPPPGTGKRAPPPPTWQREAAEWPTTTISDWKCNFTLNRKCWGLSRNIHSEKKVFTSSDDTDNNNPRD